MSPYTARTQSLEVHVRATISVGKAPEWFWLTPDGQVLYVTDSLLKSLFAIKTATNRVIEQIPLGCTPSAIAGLPDGASILVGCDAGLRLIALRTRTVDSLSTGVVGDLALAEGSNVVYYAGGQAGLFRMDLATRQVFQVHALPIVERLAVLPGGKFLYVNYQQSGPGGSPGHDAIGKFDIKTNTLIRAISGFPNVGDTLAVSPDGRQLWANGLDACSSRAYDHLGCPAVPAGVVNVIETATDRLVRTLPFIGGGVRSITFTPDATFALLNGVGPRFIDTRILSVRAGLSGLNTYSAIFTRNGSRAYTSLMNQGGVAVLEIHRECQSPAPHLRITGFHRRAYSISRTR